ncbi:MAG: RNA polymerase sigma factor [Acidobacteria bacterium]|nr:RNA polymerase sigma factor [Acidobacteriota bacterium]
MLEALMADLPRVADLSFEQVVRQREVQVLRTAYRILGNWADAEDVAQEAFVRLHRRGLGFSNEAALGGWLYRVTVNLCLDAAIREQQKVTLMAALPTLPARERAAVVLREIEELPTAEVAAILGSTEGTVRSQSGSGGANRSTRLEAHAVEDRRGGAGGGLCGAGSPMDRNDAADAQAGVSGCRPAASPRAASCSRGPKRTTFGVSSRQTSSARREGGGSRRRCAHSYRNAGPRRRNSARRRGIIIKEL